MSSPKSSSFDDAAQVWNRRFERPDYLFGTEPNGWLATNVQALAAGGRVLCVADGEGRNSVWLAQRGFAVEAFDISPVGVAKARQLALQAGVQVTFSVASCDDFAWPQASYDAVVAIFIQFADPGLRARIFEHSVQSLKPGGTLILQGYTPKQLEYKTGGPSILSHLYTEDLLRSSFSKLQIARLSTYEADLAEGSGHLGISALIGMVAHKP